MTKRIKDVSIFAGWVEPADTGYRFERRGGGVWGAYVYRDGSYVYERTIVSARKSPGALISALHAAREVSL